MPLATIADVNAVVVHLQGMRERIIDRPVLAALDVRGRAVLLAALPAEGQRFSAVPMRMAGTGTFPVRAWARVPGDALSGRPSFA